MNWKDELKKKYRALPVMMCEDDLYETFIPFIESLLKEQRENCKDEALKTMDMPQYTGSMMARSILNAPEPTGGKK